MTQKFSAEYQHYVVPYLPPEGSNRRIRIPDSIVPKNHTLATRIAAAKSQEALHQIDGASEFKRQYTGLLGEAAIEQYFGIEIIDYTVGDSKNYNFADLRRAGFQVGVKTVEFGKFPIVHVKSYRPELICVKLSSNEVAFCGFASIDVLTNYQTDNFILDDRLRQRGTKAAFYGFSKLEAVESLEALRNICRRNP